MTCPLCNSTAARDSSFGATVYREKRYSYLECVDCGSIYTWPMPDATALSQMYGSEYNKFLSSEHCHSGEAGIKDVTNYLDGRQPGIFLDYACGAGRLVKEASDAGWKALGYEFDAGTATKFSEIHGLQIVSNLEDLGTEFRADILHLGDVLEHLTDVNVQFPKIMGLLKKHGILIAQGPLEANPNVFFRIVKLNRNLRAAGDSNMPPYHVSLATSAGQRKFFERFGLSEIEFRIFETAHPAPERISLNDLRKPRTTALFLSRKISQAVTRTLAPELGNRYFFVGRKS